MSDVCPISPLPTALPAVTDQGGTVRYTETQPGPLVLAEVKQSCGQLQATPKHTPVFMGEYHHGLCVAYACSN